jgi:hypothetical protein
MRNPARFYCADAAALADDPLPATAPPADQWLLVEHHGPWGPRALADTRLDPVAVAAMQRWVRERSGRATLIRPAGGPYHARPHKRWFLVDARPGMERIRSGWLSNQRQLVDVLADPHAGETSDEPIYLICGHGKRDPCCAIRGRPVAAALTRQWPQRAWECTHLGGDRFAANVVLLPHGLYYGRLTPDTALEVVALYNSGLVEPRLLRGRSSLPAFVQAAQHHARLSLGDDRVDVLPPVDVRPLDADTWQVRLRTADDGLITVLVRARTVVTDRPLTCTGRAQDGFRTFDLIDIHQPSPRWAGVPNVG